MSGAIACAGVCAGVMRLAAKGMAVRFGNLWIMSRSVKGDPIEVNTSPTLSLVSSAGSYGMKGVRAACSRRTLPT